MKNKAGKVHTVIFEDEITLFWDKQWELPDEIFYRVTLGGVVQGETVKTHFSLKNLHADTVYTVEVERLDENGNAVETLFDESVQTAKPRKRLDVTKAPYFAKGDGTTLNTAVLQKAFDDCGKDESVYFPAGVYMTGALDMHGDCELYLDEGAVLQGTAEVADYAPKRWSRFEGREMLCYSALLNIGKLDHTAGATCENIVIRGGGVVSGGGSELCWAVIESERERLKEFLLANEDYVKTCENNNTIPGRSRPRLVSVNNAKNIIFANVTFQYGAAWNIHMVYSKNIVTYGCKIDSKGVWNGDGWNPDSCENCTIFNTEFQTHDDAIAIKSGKNPEGNIINRPTKDIRIFDCHGVNGIALGSEMSGGIENVYVWDCRFYDGIAGFRVKTTRKRGGYVRNVRVRNSALAEIRLWTGYKCNDDGEGASKLAVLENFSFENIEVAGTSIEDGKRILLPPITLMGFNEESHYLRNVSFKNVKMRARKDGEMQQIQIQNVDNLTLENITFVK